MRNYLHLTRNACGNHCLEDMLGLPPGKQRAFIDEFRQITKYP
jgi:hypothetical protein